MRFVAVCAMLWATQLAAQEQPDARPPVLRGAEASDDQVITLPGAVAPRLVAVIHPRRRKPRTITARSSVVRPNPSSRPSSSATAPSSAKN